MKPVAFIPKTAIGILEFKISPNTPVFIGETNIEHIKSRYPYEYEKYFPDIGQIIATQDEIQHDEYIMDNAEEWN